MGLFKLHSNIYENAFRQKLNKEKTFLFFSKNTIPLTREYIMQDADLRVSSNLDLDLGLPSFIGKSKIATFQGIVE